MIEGLREFVRESNMIEGIGKEADNDHLMALVPFLNLHRLTTDDVEDFVSQITHPPARLRVSSGDNVRVGGHIPMSGGPWIKTMLSDLLLSVTKCKITAFKAHIRYETLHPFMDGNGRSGRAIWLWQMQKELMSCPSFLHQFYYQTLRHTR